jgi:exopolysaccharide biosynthesis polyprenyl glycosylphosphotransferase
MQCIINSGAKEVIAEGLPETQLASQLYWQLRNAGIGLRLIPSSLMLLHRRGTPEIFASMPMIRIESSLLANWEYIFKRCLDMVSAFIGLIVLSPVFMGIAIAIKTSSKGSVFYTQDRVGLHGQSFRMWKFRSMFMDADRRQTELEHLNKSSDGVMFKIERDPRIIPIGHFLRCTSLDELPQLFNVLLGQMSLVGPRPLPVRDVARFTNWHHTRHLVMPGITGLWQISGRSDLDTIDDVAKLDLFYIDRWSLNFDLEILIETLRLILFGKGAY